MPPSQPALTIFLSDFSVRAQTDWKRQRAWLPNWKPTKGELERKLGLKNSIRKEKKEISSLEASLEMYEKSLAHLEEVNAKYDIVKQGKKMAKGKPFDSKVPYMPLTRVPIRISTARYYNILSWRITHTPLTPHHSWRRKTKKKAWPFSRPPPTLCPALCSWLQTLSG